MLQRKPPRFRRNRFYMEKCKREQVPPPGAQPPRRFRLTDRLRAAHGKGPANASGEQATMMLLTIHKNDRAPQASSLYCVWTPGDRNPGFHLAAIWMDSECGL